MSEDVVRTVSIVYVYRHPGGRSVLTPAPHWPLNFGASSVEQQPGPGHVGCADEELPTELELGDSSDEDPFGAAGEDDAVHAELPVPLDDAGNEEDVSAADELASAELDDRNAEEDATDDELSATALLGDSSDDDEMAALDDGAFEEVSVPDETPDDGLADNGPSLDDGSALDDGRSLDDDSALDDELPIDVDEDAVNEADELAVGPASLSAEAAAQKPLSHRSLPAHWKLELQERRHSPSRRVSSLPHLTQPCSEAAAARAKHMRTLSRSGPTITARLTPSSRPRHGGWRAIPSACKEPGP